VTANDPFRFICSICEEPSKDICIRCTRDTCPNHLCSVCHRCSDCCECEVVALEEARSREAAQASGSRPA
jgi:hypothetical protein